MKTTENNIQSTPSAAPFYKKSFKLKGDEEFFINMIVTEEAFRSNSELIEMFNRLATESEIDLNKKLLLKGEKLKTLHKPEELWQVNDKWLKESFETDANRTVFFISDSNDKPIVAIIALINDPASRSKMNVPDGGSFIYVTHAITNEEFKGQGMLSLLFNKVNSMLMNPKRGLETPLTYSISVSVATALKDNSEFDYVMNLPTYSRMWSNRFEDNRVQMRFQKIGDPSKQEGLERLPLKDFMDKDSLDESKINDLVNSRKDDAAKDGKFVRGLFLEGVDKRTHAETQLFRRAALGQFLER